MWGRRAKWLSAFFGAAVLLLLSAGAFYGILMKRGQPAGVEHGIDDARRRPLVMAHRGGAGEWPENTLYAFRRASELGVDVLEIDMHATADGALVIIHDSSLERTTDGHGLVKATTLAQLKTYDAAYRWSPDGGRSFPLRGQGVTVPTLQEVFAAMPDMRFNIDIKQAEPSLVKPFCRALRESGMESKVMVASFKSETLEEFRGECAEVATSASTSDVLKYLALDAFGMEAARHQTARALQVPEYAFGRRILSREFVEAAHRNRLEVHAWTINDEASLRRMLEIGVDGIITDYPARLLRMLDP